LRLCRPHLGMLQQGLGRCARQESTTPSENNI
jgi:hypothetical protein